MLIPLNNVYKSSGKSKKQTRLILIIKNNEITKFNDKKLLQYLGGVNYTDKS